MIVWASNKNRRNPGAPLHTNFKLGASPGGYLALVRPDLSIATQFAPTYPPQAADISYGFPVTSVTNGLAPLGTAARVLVPANSTVDGLWQTPDFNDSAWSNTTSGVAFTNTVWVGQADSLADFSGTQGAGNWSYGYYNKTADTVTPGYQTNDFIRFPNSGTGWSTSNYWTGMAWDYYGANPPYTTIQAQYTHPNGTNNTSEHWAIRRWTANTNGLLRVDWWLAKQNVAGGNGVSGYLFHNGAQKDTATVAYNDAVGAIRSVFLTNVAVGDVIDFAVSPTGADGQAADGSDGSYAQMWVFAPAATANIRSQMWNTNSSAYLRIPFTVGNPSTLDAMLLRIHYADGFVAWLNGTLVARRNAPSLAAGGVVADSVADWSAIGAQAYNGWSYGYYNVSADTNSPFAGLYRTSVFDTTDDRWFFNGAAWVLDANDPPYTMISVNTWQPNGTNNFANHWPIRRWLSDASGVVTARVSFAKAVIGGSGATLRVFLNGSQKFARTIAGSDTTGFTTNLLFTGLEWGDMVDFALDPLGTDGQSSDASDVCTFNAVFTRAASFDPAWNSTATADATATETQTGETMDLSGFKSFLLAGTNVLAIQGLNSSAGDSGFVLLPELLGVTTTANTNQRVYFRTPTPGKDNGNGTTNLGPLVLDAAFAPLQPATNSPITITARAAATFSAVTNLTLAYRVMYNTETNLPMYDDGLHGDGAAGDGVFGTVIPANVAKAGQMVRWCVTATDAAGTKTRAPAYLDVRSPQYYGAVITDLSITSNLPVLHWFIQTPTAADTDTGTRCSFYYNGQFRDNIGATLHGQSSGGFPKKSYNFNLNPGEKITWNPAAPDLSDFALITTYADRSEMRPLLSYDTYAAAGAPGHFAFNVRIQQNAAFFSVANFTEQGNEDFLKRIGLDPNGALYKMYNGQPMLATGNEKKTRKDEPAYDLQALITGVSQADANAKAAYVYDNINIPEMITSVATKAINSDTDCCHKNHYLYRDTVGTGEWQMMPWDVDLTYGHLWTGTYFDDNITTNGLVTIGTANTVLAALWADPAIQKMWLRRIRTLMDTLLQPPGTPTNTDILRSWVNNYETQIGNDAALDLAKWGSATWTPSSPVPPRNLTNETARIKDNYLTGRRAYLFINQVTNTPLLPQAQPDNVVINFGAVEYNPASANQAQEYIELVNTNPIAVDISGWKLDGGVQFTFIAGTIIAPTNHLYVSPDVKSFRARTTGPRGGQRLLVVGPYTGQLSARGESLALLTASAQTNSTLTYAGTPSAAQSYLRITELMYNPAPQTGPYDAQEYEFIELKNISGSVALDLTGVKFDAGVTFDFTGSAVTSLAPGQRVLVVKNPSAFALRYGAGFNIAGTYTGSLDNAGEQVRLLDASNEKVLDFTYNNSWYPITDGVGFSLAIVDELAVPDAWNAQANWRPSGVANGTPGASDPGATVQPTIVVNELLTHPFPQDLDAVELHNPTSTNVDIGGWFLTDTFASPKKFRIPNGTTLVAGGYLVFTENDFNPGGLGFSFSSQGEEVYLFSGDAAGNLTGYYHGFAFEGAETNVTFGRYVNSTGDEDFAAQLAPTLGTNNAGPVVGPVVLSEIMYHPASLTSNDPPASYIELLNITATNVPLYNLVQPTNTWRLRNAVDFDFPANVTLPPGGALLVVGFDPVADTASLASFRARYSLATDVPLYGPWQGTLANNAGVIELKKPDLAATNSVPYVMVERVHYHDSAPWPAQADGLGASLIRAHTGEYGNEPTNWTAAIPSPGTNYTGGQTLAITLQPQSQAMSPGANITFNVTATGATPMAYQWTCNGTNLPGATNATLVLNNVQTNQTGSYQVLVMNPTGTLWSQPALLALRVSITAAPSNVAVFPYANVNWTVGVAGDPPFFYQWRCNGTNLPGATNASLVKMSVLPADAGSYAIQVSNLVSSALSPVSLTVYTNPIITAQPVNLSIMASSNAAFAVTAISSTPLLYQWYYNTNTLLVGATNATIAITNAQPTNGGTYTVVVRDDFGATTSVHAYLFMNIAWAITQQPQPTNIVAFVGSSVSFTVSVSGSPPFWFRWRKNANSFTNIGPQSATNHVFSFSSVQLSDAARWDVGITNLANSSTKYSSNVFLTVIGPLTNQTARPGSNAVFSFNTCTWSPGTTLSPTYCLKYQWWFNETNLVGFGTNLSTLTNISLAITNAQAANAGVYKVIATNGVGTVLTQAATLVIIRPPQITQQPASQTAASGSPAAFTVTVDGSAPLSYRWQFNGADLPGATGPSLSFNEADPTNAGPYRVVVTNSEGSVTSDVANLTVALPPVLISQPTNVTVVVGGTASFTVIADGTPPLGYRWTVNGTNVLAWATGATITLTNAQAANAGYYQVAVSNAAGVRITQGAMLTVLSAPSLSVPLVGQTVECSNNAVFTVTADGATPLYYQWFFGANPIPGATDQMLVVPEVSSTNAGQYSVLVTNSVGSATGGPVMLNVADTTAPQILFHFTNLTLIAGTNGTVPMPDVTGTNYLLAVDHCSSVTVTQSVATNAPLAVGTNPVVLAAFDASGNAAYSTNFVLVVDQTPPSITCPGNISVPADAEQSSRSNVAYTANATDNCAVTNVSCVPPSGSTFSLGAHSVHCTATDSSGNTAACDFNVVVTGSGPLVVNAADTVNVRIPDGSPVGLVSEVTLATPIERITNVTVTLNISGGFNGDLYACLVHDSGHAILLNRVGKTLANPSGYSDAGFNITLQDQAAHGDIHSYRIPLLGDPNAPLAGPLTNAWAPDGRDTDPALALDSDPRASTLSTFHGLNPNGGWRLFIADLDALYSSTLVSWGLEVRGTNAPPVINAPPQSRTNAVGTEAVFTVAATGLSALHYQWYFGATPISGATNASFSIAHAQTTNAGNYKVEVTTLGGSVMSATATLTVETLLVTGQLALDEFTGLAHDGHGTRLVTFKATDGNGQVVATWNQTLEFTPGMNGRGVASYTLTNVPWGATNLSAKTDWHLRKRLPLAFVGRAAEVNFIGALRLLGGDFDNSNTVNLTDYQRLVDAWYTTQDAADIDGSGLVDIVDYFIMASHWLQLGDPE